MTAVILQHHPHKSVDERLRAFQGVKDAVEGLLNDVAESTDVREVETIYHWAKANWQLLTDLVDAAGHKLPCLQAEERR